MKNDLLDGRNDRLAEGRLRRFNKSDLEEELDSSENISTLSDGEGDEVFGE